MPTQTTADKLRRAVAKAEKQGASLREIARAAGTSPTTITNLMAGTEPRLDVAERIAKAVGCKITLTCAG